MGSSVVNARKFADWQNSSFLPVAGKLKGERVWFSAPPARFAGDVPLHLAITDGLLITIYTRWIDVREPDTGKRIRVHEGANFCDLNIDPEGIWVASEDGAFYKLSLSGGITKKTDLVFFAEHPKLFYVAPHGDDSFYIYNRLPGSFDPPVLSQGFVITAFNVNKRKVAFEHIENEPALGFALSPDMTTGFAATDHGFLIFPIPSTRQADVRKFELPSIRSFSVYSDNCIIAAQAAGKMRGGGGFEGRRLVAVSLRGKIKWEVKLDNFSASGQPPAFAPGGPVYYCDGSRLLGIEKGTVLWKRELAKATPDIYLTVLKDASVLAAGGDRLYWLSPTGRPLLKLKAPLQASCRPLMDARGRVYLAGTEGVWCLR